MSFKVKFLPEAENDLKKLDHSVRPQILKGIAKVSKNPVSIYKGGYGKPLGNRNRNDLTHLYKIKFRGIGIRVVYSLEEREDSMIVIIISVRDDEKVYAEASNRRRKHKL